MKKESTTNIVCPTCNGAGLKTRAKNAFACNRCGGNGYLSMKAFEQKQPVPHVEKVFYNDESWESNTELSDHQIKDSKKGTDYAEFLNGAQPGFPEDTVCPHYFFSVMDDYKAYVSFYKARCEKISDFDNPKDWTTMHCALCKTKDFADCWKLWHKMQRKRGL